MGSMHRWRVVAAPVRRKRGRRVSKDFAMSEDVSPVSEDAGRWSPPETCHGHDKLSWTECQHVPLCVYHIFQRMLEQDRQRDSSREGHDLIPYSKCMDENCGYHEEQKAGVLVTMPEHSRHKEIVEWAQCVALHRCEHHDWMREQERTSDRG